MPEFVFMNFMSLNTRAMFTLLGNGRNFPVTELLAVFYQFYTSNLSLRNQTFGSIFQINHCVTNSSNQSRCDQSFRLIRRIDHQR